MSDMRYYSVDVLRGLTVALMILVNNPGSWSYVYPWLEHAEWNGLHLADLVFPFFLYIVGLSIVFSLRGKKISGNVGAGTALKILKRGGLLVLLGIFLNAVPHFDWQSLRLPGVLQRIGIVFSLTALAYLYLDFRQRAALSVLILQIGRASCRERVYCVV